MDEAPRCQVCATDLPLAGEVHRCPRCETPHHRECWDYNGGCATYACAEAPAVRRSGGQRAEGPRGRSGIAIIETDPVKAGRRFVYVAVQYVMMLVLAGVAFGLVFARPVRVADRYDRDGEKRSRAEVLWLHDREGHLRELDAIAKERACTEAELQAIAHIMTWSPDTAERRAAVRALCNLQRDDAVVQELLASSFGNADPEIHPLVVYRLKRFASLTERAVRDLELCVASKDPEVARSAGELLAGRVPGR